MYGLSTIKMHYAKDEWNLYEMDSYEWELSKNHMIEILARGQPKKKKKQNKLIYVGKKLLNY